MAALSRAHSLKGLMVLNLLQFQRDSKIKSKKIILATLISWIHQLNYLVFCRPDKAQEMAAIEKKGNMAPSAVK